MPVVHVDMKAVFYFLDHSALWKDFLSLSWHFRQDYGPYDRVLYQHNEH